MPYFQYFTEQIVLIMYFKIKKKPPIILTAFQSIRKDILLGDKFRID